MELNRKLLTGALMCAGLLLYIPLTADAAEVYRWVDEDGNVHYSEALPPQHSDKEHDVLNERGIVVEEDLSLKPEPPPPEEPVDEEEKLKELPRDSSGLPRPKQLYSDAELQRRMDNFLMLRYDSEQEIVEAMNVEIKQLNYDRHLIEGTHNSTEAAYRGHIQQAADRQRAGLPVDASVTSEISSLQAKMAGSSSSLAGLEQREQNIRADFQKQLDRYRFLVESAEAEADAEAAESG